MQIQSLSVVVPNSNCINNCKFCVSHMHPSPYPNQIDDNLPFFDLYLKDYIKRLDFARRNGCNTVMLTGNSEPQQNRKFMTYFGMFLMLMQEKFGWIEMQTTGILLDRNYLRFLRNHVGVNLISLSLSSFINEENASIVGMPVNSAASHAVVQRHCVDIEDLCKTIREYDFSLRLSLNITDAFAAYSPEQIFEKCKALGANQVTIRKMYHDGSENPQAMWLKYHEMAVDKLSDYIKTNGTPLAILPYGAVKYSLHGMSVVCDTDCMATDLRTKLTGVEPDSHNGVEQYKYLILQPNAKLYSAWDDPASLIF